MSRGLVLSIICALLLHFSSGIAGDTTVQTYIVHVELPDAQVSSDESFDLESYYQSFMPTIMAGTTDPRRITYSYRHVMTGFAAKLSADDVKEMSKKSGFIMANPERILSLHTTHTPNFMGLIQGSGFWEQSNYGKNTTICVLDTGITWDHPSFNDVGMGAPPAKWKGKCNLGSVGKCNKKLIGATYFSDGDGTALDREGHGTHTASTAAGNYVAGANLNGLANGMAAGIAPWAHLATYKICTEDGCPDSATIAAMDSAIVDGCDVLSMSLGGAPQPYHRDSIATGAFAAMKYGMLVSASGGNDGPGAQTISNEAPWMLTVAASTHDRKLVSSALLGNGMELLGETGYQPSDWTEKQLPLVYPSNRYCTSTLSSASVKGKIVVCQLGQIGTYDKGVNVKKAGGLAMIVPNDATTAYSTFSEANVIPATNINYEDAKKLLAYYNSVASPTATIKNRGTIIGEKNAPEISYFSSRGPSTITPGILKPDITGPGVNILAGWPVSVDVNPPTTKKNFNIISGTSMSCPHLSGVVALIKSSHPTWSPAAIKSAIITTADKKNLGGQPIKDERHIDAGYFAMGAGHVNPAKANDPGLVYDNEPKDYLPYLCGLGYTATQIRAITKENWSCTTSILEGELNQPTFTVLETSTFTRTVTNVGNIEVYVAEVAPPRGVKVEVTPSKLTFTKLNEKQTYKVTFTKTSTSGISEGYITWKSAKHTVTSPVISY